MYNFEVSLCDKELYLGEYNLDEYSVLIYSWEDSSYQLFFGLDRHTFLGINSDTGRCYSVSIMLDAVIFELSERTIHIDAICDMYYRNSEYKTLPAASGGVIDDFQLKYKVNVKQGLIFKGDESADGEIIEYSQHNYALVKEGKLQFLILRVSSDIIDYIFKHRISSINPC